MWPSGSRRKILDHNIKTDRHALHVRPPFLYSLNTILTNSIVDFYPVSPVSRLLNTAEIFTGFIIIVILFFMYANIKSDKAKTEMDSLVTSLEQQGSELEIFINQEFSMDISQAIAEIEKLPNNFIKVIYHFTSRPPKQ